MIKVLYHILANSFPDSKEVKSAIAAVEELMPADAQGLEDATAELGIALERQGFVYGFRAAMRLHNECGSPLDTETAVGVKGGVGA